MSTTHCYFCGTSKEVSSLKRCSKCHTATYCDETCQKADWKRGGHKLECDQRLRTFPVQTQPYRVLNARSDRVCPDDIGALEVVTKEDSAEANQFAFRCLKVDPLTGVMLSTGQHDFDDKDIATPLWKQCANYVATHEESYLVFGWAVFQSDTAYCAEPWICVFHDKQFKLIGSIMAGLFFPDDSVRGYFRQHGRAPLNVVFWTN